MEQTVNEKPKLTPAQLKKRRNQRNVWLRAAIQTFFFFAMPSAFIAGFSGIRGIFQSIGSGQMLQWTSFAQVLVMLCVFTILFGRYFCGFVCAFGSLGDFVYWLSGLVQKKLLRKKKQYTLPDRFTPWEQKVKYAVLAMIVILCAVGVYDAVSGWDPWSVFSFLTAMNFRLAGYWGGLVLLVLILAGMAVKERFFCQFLCPMGAVFSLLPVLPFANLQRNPETCLRGCKACQRQCPVSIKLESDGISNGECIACEKCSGVCPKNNLTRWDRKYLKHEMVSVLLKAALFFALGALLGLCRFF